jgi:hypothetical protein
MPKYQLFVMNSFTEFFPQTTIKKISKNVKIAKLVSLIRKFYCQFSRFWAKLVQSLLHTSPAAFSPIYPVAIFFVVCDPPMNELWATYAGLWICLYGSRLLTARSQKGRTQLKIRNLVKTSCGKTWLQKTSCALVSLLISNSLVWAWGLADWVLTYLLSLMRLCHPPDGSTSPEYMLLCSKPP